MTDLPPFEDPAIEKAYQRIVTWADGRGWVSTPLRRAGSRLERSWTQGEPGKGRTPAPGTTRAAISVFASTRASTTYGIAWSAACTEPKGRGLRLLVVSGGRAVTPDQVRIDLHLGAEPAIALGAPLTWSVGERAIQTPPPSGLDEVLAKLAAYQGPAFAEAGAADLRELDAMVRPVLEHGDYTVCDYGPLPGKGLPAPCLPRAPTEDERAAYRNAFDAELARRRDALGDGALWAELLGWVAPTTW